MYLLAVSIGLLFLPATTFADGMSFWDQIKPPEDISVNGHHIDSLFNYVTWVNLFFFALVCLGLFGFSFWYSKKRHPKALYTHGYTKSPMMVAVSVFMNGCVVRSGLGSEEEVLPKKLSSSTAASPVCASVLPTRPNL